MTVKPSHTPDFDADTLRRALQSLLTGDATAIKQARKDLDRISMPRGRKQLTSDRILLDAFAKLPTVDAHHQGSFLASIGPISLNFMGKKPEYLFDEIMRYIENSSGTVRRGALSLASWWRMRFHDRRKRGTPAEELARIRPFLLHIKKSIAEHQPKPLPDDEPVYLNGLKPSVYKSLLLLWEECVRNPSMEELLENDEELRDDMPVRNYEDESWLHENELNFDDVSADLWGEHDPDRCVCEAMDDLARMSIDRLGAELATLGFSSTEILDLVEELKNSDLPLGHGTILFQQFVCTCATKGIDFNTMNNAIRAFQAATNHIEWLNQCNQPVSYLLVNCVFVREENGRTAPKDIGTLAVLLRDSHRSIDTYIDELLHMPSWSPELPLELRRVIEGELAEMHRRRMECLRQIRSIAHHVIDWYFQLEPWGVQRYSPKQHAALTLFIVKRINEENGIFADIPFSNMDVASYGGWKSMNAYSGLYYAIKNGVHDLSLLCLQVEEDL